MKYQNKLIRYLNECKFHNLINLFILLISIFFICIALEGGLRIYDSKPLFELINYREDAIKNRLPSQYHELLGWIPQLGSSGTHNIWKKEINILSNGIRSNGNNIEYGHSQPILVVGDSFTFGAEVSDNETWPAALERLAEKQVINAGVFAYGLDQSLLRLKMLTPKYKPDTIIISFIPQDIMRCECSYFCRAYKPYFIVTNGSLRLMGTPVKQDKIKTDRSFRIFGYSYFIHRFMMKYYVYYWFRDYFSMVQINNQGEEITCLLFKELDTIARRNHIKKVYVLIQDTNPPSSYPLVDPTLVCINKNRIQVIDLRKNLSEIQKHDESLYNSFFINGNGHMTPLGNKFVAETIFRTMQEN